MHLLAVCQLWYLPVGSKGGGEFPAVEWLNKLFGIISSPAFNKLDDTPIMNFLCILH